MFSTQKKNQNQKTYTKKEMPSFFALNAYEKKEALKQWSRNYRTEVIAYLIGVSLKELSIFFKEHDLEFPNNLKKMGTLSPLSSYGNNHFTGTVDKNFFMHLDEFFELTVVSQMKIVSDLLEFSKEKKLSYTALIKKHFNCECFSVFYRIKGDLEKNPKFKKSTENLTQDPTLAGPVTTYKASKASDVIADDILDLGPNAKSPKLKEVKDVVDFVPKEQPTIIPALQEQPTTNDAKNILVNNNISANINGTSIKMSGQYTVRAVMRKLAFIGEELAALSPDAMVNLDLLLNEESKPAAFFSEFPESSMDEIRQLVEILEEDLPF